MDKGAKILVVDDERRICHSVEKILSRNDYEVTHATSAQEALEKLAEESYSLLISDIVMPGRNGLELLKLVKESWPLTKAVMMTAYASTDTAVKAIRLGALDYLPKPFTPDELRTTVGKALSGELTEADTSPAEREAIDVIDVDIPYDRNEVAEAAGEAYADSLGRSDMPVVEVPSPESLPHYCAVGGMICDIHKKLGDTCKAGVKTGECPQLAKKARKGDAEPAAEAPARDLRRLIGIDMPFNYNEVAAITGPEYVRNLDADGFAFVPYEDLKARYADTVGDRPSAPAESAEPRHGVVPANYCEVGDMACDIFAKLGNTCKAGIKSAECPQLKKGKGRGKAAVGPAVETLVGVDMPFDYQEVARAAGPGYAQYVTPDGFARMPYEAVKARYAETMSRASAAEDDRKAAEAPVHPPVLVVDDEVAVNHNIRKILTKKGYAVDQATTKAEALEKIESRRYALVLLDLKIPGVRGLELLEAIRDQSPETKVIIITGYASIDTAVEGARMGAVAYIPKPFTPTEIREAATEALQLAA